MVQQASKAVIDLLVKKSKAAKKSKVESKMNNIDEEIDDLRLTEYAISTIYVLEYIPDDDWNIGL